ncbi:MAG: alpha/beta hydrolase-fold protein [Gammaproteobacteria bacterium]|nr:alpha/beta hydrolase-fold protein [Gammaproteobacteria bacterium]
MRRCCSLLLVVVLAVSDTAAETDFRHLQSIGDTRYHRLDSSITDQRYHLFVRLPESYAQSEQRYPVVFLLDGGWLYPLIAGYYRYLNQGDEVPEMIVVGISYGTDDFREGNHRSTDYTAASDERDFWGGAAKFRQALSAEIIPLIDVTYRSQADRRILVGQSIGGQFVLYAALTEPKLFWGYIASNPALHRNLPFFLRRYDEPQETTGARVFVASGTEDDVTFREPALQWMRHWTSIVPPPWSLCATDLAGHSHFSAPPAAFRGGMRWLFGLSSPDVSCRTVSVSSGSDPQESPPR